jgi:formate-dependent nitrite reductase membrane component NrfD
MPGEVWIDRRLPSEAQAKTGSGADVQSQPQDYYGVSMLQPPVWEPQYIGPYFFLGGLSAGAFLLARAAELVGGREYRDVTRAGTTVALLAALPCAPLLIKDLGDPRRFHHMLRVFKPSSPMNMGTWVISGYSSITAAAVYREWLRGPNDRPRGMVNQALDKSISIITNAAGIPLALMMTCYTGVLLSGTATPIWSKNPWLAPLFSAGAMANGAGAINLALHYLRRHQAASEQADERALDRFETIAHIAEAIFMIQYLRSLGRLNKPLLAGKDAFHMVGSAGAMVASEVLKKMATRGKLGRWMKIASSCLDLASGLGVKYGIVNAGKASASNAQDARLSSSLAHGTRRRFGAEHKFPHLSATPSQQPQAARNPRM